MKNEVKKQETELVIFQQFTPLQIFKENKGDDFISKLEKDVEKFNETRDVTTDKGRKEIKSFSYGLGRHKAPLTETRLQISEEVRATLKEHIAEDNRLQERIQELQDLVRQPLTDFENVEKERIEFRQNRIKEMGAYDVKDWELNLLPGHKRNLDDLIKSSIV